MSELILPEEPGLVLPARDIDPRLRSVEAFQVVDSVRFETLQTGSEILYAGDGSVWYLRVEELSDSGKPRVVRQVIDEIRDLNHARTVIVEPEAVMTLMGACNGVDVYRQPKDTSDEPKIEVAKCLWFLIPKEPKKGWDASEFTSDVSRPIQRLAVAA